MSRLVTQQHLPGDSRSNRLGRGIEFSEVKTYQPGDDVRSIDWRAWARSGQTYSRLFTEERERQMHVLVDQRASMFFGSRSQFKSVLAAKLAAATIWASLDDGFRISGQISAETELRTKARSTRSAAMDLITSTARQNCALSVQSKTSRSLTDMLSYTLANTPTGSYVTLISDFHDLKTDTIKLLTSICQHRKTQLLLIFDPVEKLLPLNLDIGISDGSERQRVHIDSLLQEQQLQLFESRVHTLKKIALTTGAVLSLASTDHADQRQDHNPGDQHG
ncbi:MAG: DUF58 domain-containing protein [Gammaproteobacteria bacterium]|nr:DUF58 domain-containing protein [Gammaproteobacteria bacterium]